MFLPVLAGLADERQQVLEQQADVRARGPRGEAPAGFICGVVLASASRSEGRVAPVVITGRCSGLRSGPRQYSPGIIW